MNSEGWKRVERPPLGKIRDLNKKRKEEAEKRLAFKFIALERHQELVGTLNRLGNEINDLRTKLNMPELQFHISDVRLINKELWNQFTKDAHFSEEDVGAFWDPLTEKVYIKYNPEQYRDSRLERVYMMYTIAHELAHKSLPNINGYSFHLAEGLADFVARTVLERGVFSLVLTQEERYDRKTYIKTMHLENEGFDLRPEDIIVEEPEVGAIYYSRIPQLRLVEKLHDTDPEAFDKLLALSFSGKHKEAEQLIEQTWGQDLAKGLAGTYIDIKSMLSMISKRKLDLKESAAKE